MLNHRRGPDRIAKEANLFLHLLDQRTPAFTFQTFKEKGATVEIPPKIVNGRSLGPLRIEHEHGAGIYVCINETNGAGRKSEHVVRIRGVWQEDDDGYTGGFPLRPSIVVETSPGHFHRYWLIADHWPADEQGRADFASVMERMVASYGSDNNAKDISRVMRLPGFLNRKITNGSAQRFEIRIVEAGGQHYTRAQIMAAFPPVPHETKKQTERNSTQGDEVERIRAALDYIRDVDDREIWRNVGMALKQHLGEDGRHLWGSWSRPSSKFDQKDQDKTWASFHKHDIKIGTLFHYAKERGWQAHTGPKVNTGSTAHQASHAEAAPQRSAVLVRADTLKPESISWAWPNRFAFGKMAMIAGDPGLGKSTILIDIAALHSNGGDFPCGEGKAAPCEVLFLTAEDGLRDTLIPRLIAAGADLTKIHFLTGTKTEGAASDEIAMFDINKDVALLRQCFTNNPAMKVLIIDPLTAYLGVGTKAKENTDVRRVLTPLVKLAEEFGVLLLANNHLNKNSGKALYRILDSIAFVALGRTVHLVAMDTDIKENRKFICDKSNIGSRPLGLTYIIQKVWIDGEQGEQIETSRICWGTQHIDESADEALSAEAATATATDEAIEFLNMVLANGRVRIHDVEVQAREARLLGDDQQIRLSKPFRAARKILKVIFSRDGFGAGAVCYWSLPEHNPESPTIGATIGATSNARAPMESEGTYDEKEAKSNDGGWSSSLHTCPRIHTCPPNGSGTYEGTYGAGPGNGLAGVDQAVTTTSTATIPVDPMTEPAMVCLHCGGGIPAGSEITVRSSAAGNPLALVHPGCLDAWQGE